jgi:DNA-binding NarL/FixJ family response regulator
MLIYVVDDHELMRDATMAFIRGVKRTDRVIGFSNFEEFIKAVDVQGVPDVLILDLKLPRIQGCEGVLRARTCCPSSKIAVYSASPALEQEQQCIGSGADIYIEKINGAGSFTIALRNFLSCAK